MLFDTEMGRMSATDPHELELSSLCLVEFFQEGGMDRESMPKDVS